MDYKLGNVWLEVDKPVCPIGRYKAFRKEKKKPAQKNRKPEAMKGKEKSQKKDA